MAFPVTDNASNSGFLKARKGSIERATTFTASTVARGISTSSSIWRKQSLLKKSPSGIFPAKFPKMTSVTSAVAFSSCPTTLLSSSLVIHHRHQTQGSAASVLPRKKGAASSCSVWWTTFTGLLVAVTLLLSATSAEGKHAWERPGCHKVGHTRKVTIPECMEFTITTNACRGYCESFAVPSAWYRLQNNPSQAITSVGQCCNIMETEDVTVSVWCYDGQKELVFKSAKSCACYHCKKD